VAGAAAQVPVPYRAFKGFVNDSPRTLTAIAAVDYQGRRDASRPEGADGVNVKASSPELCSACWALRL
jgi:hypothetical protein